jgi:hypothetical protein
MSDTRTLDPAIEALRESLRDVELSVLTEGFTLADAVREGSTVTGQATGAWTRPNGDACALSAAFTSAKARGLV